MPNVIVPSLPVTKSKPPRKSANKVAAQVRKASARTGDGRPVISDRSRSSVNLTAQRDVNVVEEVDD